MTFTRIYTGEPKLKGTPRGNPGCTQPVLAGNRLGVLGSWEGPTAVSVVDGTQFYLPGGGGNDFSQLAHGWGATTTVNAARCSRSTANPRSGSYHLRILAEDEESIQVRCSGGVNCNPVPDESGPVVARVNPGNLVSFTSWVDRDETPPDGTFLVVLEIWSQAQNLDSLALLIEGATSGYEELAGDIIAPDEAYWVTLRMASAANSSTSTTDVDDIALTVTL